MNQDRLMQETVEDGFFSVFKVLISKFIRIRQITRLPKKVSPPDRGGES